MPDFKNLNALEKYLIKMIKDGMEDVGQICENQTRQEIENMVYDNPTSPNYYERTRELENSLIHTQPKQIGDEIVTEIKHEDNLMGYYLPNQHVSVVNGSELSVESLAEIVNDGKAGNIFGEGYWTKPRRYIEKSKEEIIRKKLHVRILKNSLKSKGLEVEG